VEELDRFSEQDENVRRILNRRDKVDNLKVHQSSQQQKSMNISQKLSTSPMKNSGMKSSGLRNGRSSYAK
jgi:hypothetical protein